MGMKTVTALVELNLTLDQINTDLNLVNMRYNIQDCTGIGYEVLIGVDGYAIAYFNYGKLEAA